MKTLIEKHLTIILLSSIIGLLNHNMVAQCTNCYQSIASAPNYASTLGQLDTATGQSALAAGYLCRAKGINSIVLGRDNLATTSGNHSVLIGGNLTASGSKSFIIGYGYNGQPGFRLINDKTYSLMVGFNSIYPTLFVGTSYAYNLTGKVGIGNVTSPQAKLHIKEDADSITSLYLQWSNINIARIWLGTKDYGLVSGPNKLSFKVPTGGSYVFRDGNVGIGTDSPVHLFQVDFAGSEFYLDNNVMTLHTKGAGANTVLQLMDHARNIWSIQYNFTRKTLEFKYNNANPSIYFNDDGTIGIGSASTQGYKLAVLGKILTDEVMVQHPDQWYDIVFEQNYSLPDLDELQDYIANNGHLPGIPTSAEVRENGLELAKMSGLLLQKVEELTLYILDQERRIKSLEEKLEKSHNQTGEK